MGTDTGGLEYYVNLAVSPDGSRIVLVSSGAQDASGGKTNLILLNADGTGKRAIGPGQQPSWSPDSRRIVFGSLGDLHICDVETGATRRLTNRRAAQHSWPAWSPDGKRIAFVATLSDTTGDGKVDWKDEPGVFLLNLQ
jgi:TolB protein